MFDADFNFINEEFYADGITLTQLDFLLAAGWLSVYLAGDISLARRKYRSAAAKSPASRDCIPSCE